MRLTKYAVKGCIANAIRRELSVKEWEGLLAARQEVFGVKRRSYVNIFGQTIKDKEALYLPPLAPGFTSQEADKNPWLDYLTDKIAEGVAEAHQRWQFGTRLRGEIDAIIPWEALLSPQIYMALNSSLEGLHVSGYIKEPNSGILFNEVIPNEGIQLHSYFSDRYAWGRLCKSVIPDNLEDVNPDIYWVSCLLGDVAEYLPPLKTLINTEMMAGFAGILNVGAAGSGDLSSLTAIAEIPQSIGKVGSEMAGVVTEAQGTPSETPGVLSVSNIMGGGLLSSILGGFSSFNPSGLVKSAKAMYTPIKKGIAQANNIRSALEAQQNEIQNLIDAGQATIERNSAPPTEEEVITLVENTNA